MAARKYHAADLRRWAVLSRRPCGRACAYSSFRHEMCDYVPQTNGWTQKRKLLQTYAC